MDPRWRAIVDASPLVVVVVNARGAIVDVNRMLAPFSREEALGQSVYLFVADESVAEMRGRLERVFATGIADRAEMRAADGRWFSVHSVPVVDEGIVKEVVLLCDEATAMKAKEEDLALRERRFRALVEKSSDGFALLDASAGFLYASPSTAKLLGRGFADVDPFTLVHPDDRAVARAAFERILQTTVPVHARVRMLQGDNVRILDFVLANMLHDPEVGGIVSNFRDVTDLESARHERDRFFELSADLLCVASPDGSFTRLNAAWEQTLGWTREELMAQPYLDLVHPDDREATAAIHEDSIVGPVANFENRYQCRDGTYRWIQWKSAFDEASGLTYAIARDVTEKKRVDERLLHAQKMEAVGRLAGGVAHDINNMLSVIYSSTELLLSEMSEADAARSEILEIQQVAQRSAALVRQLLAFGRKRPRSVRELKIDDALGPLTKMIARCAGGAIQVITRLRSTADVRIDPSELESVLMNLALNARDAMPEGGTIEIVTEARQVGGARARELGVEPGRYVALAVRDTGCGIPVDLRPKIFEPFFTTKEIGKGTGLGLATVFGIVQQWNGAVELESTEGSGTTFTVLLPTARRPTPRSRPAISAVVR